MEIFDYVVKACTCLKDMKAENIIVIDTAKHGIAKYFVIATSTSNVQGRACANKISETLLELGLECFHREGSTTQSDWVLLDYYDFVVHIMTKDMREYYNLDKLWGDGKNTKKFETIEKELEALAKKQEKKQKKEEEKSAKLAKKEEKKSPKEKKPKKQETGTKITKKPAKTSTIKAKKESKKEAK